jgi:hypothetical protein
MQRRLWLSLHFADLSDVESLTRLVADLCVAPARVAWGLAEPRPEERDDFLFTDLGFVDGVQHRAMRQHHRITSAAHFGPVLNGLLLFGWLFPGARFDTHAPEEVVKIPGYAFLRDSQEMAYRTYEEVAHLVGGLVGRPMPPPLFHGIAPRRPQPNQPALDELRAIQDLLARAVGAPDDFGDYRRLDVGFAAMDMGAADELDVILRRDVHERLIWLGEFEPVELDDDPRPDSPVTFITFDHGVLPALVPETLSGLVALDFVESLRLDHAAGRCERCRRAMVLTPQQAARARRGLPVFHHDCHAEHRLAYWRTFQHRRATH